VTGEPAETAGSAASKQPRQKQSSNQIARPEIKPEGSCRPVVEKFFRVIKWEIMVTIHRIGRRGRFGSGRRILIKVHGKIINANPAC
jgi:hypothetical protein